MKSWPEILPGVVALRHELHRIPELAGEEKLTSAVLRERCAAVPGVKVLPPLLGTDVIALIEGGAGPGRNVTLRADVDALPIAEPEGKLASRFPGRMHACGHDAHSAMLMGALEYLAAHREDFAGSVRLIWQPGEERRALGCKLVAAGALTAPHADLVAALHVTGGLKAGTFAGRTGCVCNGSCHFIARFHGRGGHGSRPDLAANPINAAAAAITSLQGLPLLGGEPFAGTTLSVGVISGGSADNVIPDCAEFQGTLRGTTMPVIERMGEELRRLCSAAAALYRTTAEVSWRCDYHPVINDERAFALAQQVIAGMGAQLTLTPVPCSGADDFASFLEQAPGVYLFLGLGEDAPGVHTRDFTVNDDVLGTGARFLAEFALAGLRQ